MAGAGIVGEEHNPSANKYKKGKYVTKDPVEKSASETPDFSEVAELNEAGADVNGVWGTLNKPIVSNDLVSNPLFIDNQTHQEDVRQTMVTVQNPHAQTKPNYHQEDTSPDSGTFEITLESFLRSTEYITSCSVKNRRI